MWGTRPIEVRSLPGPSAAADEGSFDFAQDGHPRGGFWGVETGATRRKVLAWRFNGGTLKIP